MKKTLLFIFLTITLKMTANFQANIIASSFDTIYPQTPYPGPTHKYPLLSHADSLRAIPEGSQQWIDITITSTTTVTPTGIDSVNLWIENDSSNHADFYAPCNCYPRVLQIISNNNWASFLTIPLNADGISRRINFTLPLNFPRGFFLLFIKGNNLSGGVFGMLKAGPNTGGNTTTSTGIDQPTEKKIIAQVDFFDLLGQQVQSEIYSEETERMRLPQQFKEGIYIFRIRYRDNTYKTGKVLIPGIS